MLERIIRWITWPLAVLFIASAVVEALGVKVGGSWLPGQLSATIILAIALLAALVSRAENAEGRVSEALKGLTAKEGTFTGTLNRMEAVTVRAGEL